MQDIWCRRFDCLPQSLLQILEQQILPFVSYIEGAPSRYGNGHTQYQGTSSSCMLLMEQVWVGCGCAESECRTSGILTVKQSVQFILQLCLQSNLLSVNHLAIKEKLNVGGCIVIICVTNCDKHCGDCCGALVCQQLNCSQIIVKFLNNQPLKQLTMVLVCVVLSISANISLGG